MRLSYLEKLTLTQLRNLILRLDPVCKTEELEKRGINRRVLIKRIILLKPQLRHNAEFYINLEQRITKYVSVVSRLRILAEIHYSRYTNENIIEATKGIGWLYRDYKQDLNKDDIMSKLFFLYSISLRDDTPLNSGEGLVAIVDELREAHENGKIFRKKHNNKQKQLIARVIVEKFGSLARLSSIVGESIAAIIKSKDDQITNTYLERFLTIKSLVATKAICLMQDIYSIYQRINLHQNVSILAFEDFLIEFARQWTLWAAEKQLKNDKPNLLHIIGEINDESNKFSVSGVILQRAYGKHASNQALLGKHAIKAREKLYLVISIRGVAEVAKKVTVIGAFITYKSAKQKVANMLDISISSVKRRNISEIDGRVIVIKNFKDNMIR